MGVYPTGVHFTDMRLMGVYLPREEQIRGRTLQHYA